MTFSSVSITHYYYKKSHGDSLHCHYLICHLGKRNAFFLESNSLRFLFKKYTQYQHHEVNYNKPLDQNIVTLALAINKLPATQPISRDFSN